MHPKMLRLPVPHHGRTGPFFIRIYVHTIAKNDGTGGQTAERVYEALEYMETAFSPHSIYFVWDCYIDTIKKTSLYNTLPFGSTNVYSENPHDDGIDIYLFPDDPNGATGQSCANNIPGTALYLSGNWPETPHVPVVPSYVIAHEMGHCLGLLHTSQTNDTPCTNIAGSTTRTVSTPGTVCATRPLTRLFMAR